jgi:hypothetical protein
VERARDVRNERIRKAGAEVGGEGYINFAACPELASYHTLCSVLIEDPRAWNAWFCAAPPKRTYAKGMVCRCGLVWLFGYAFLGSLVWEDLTALNMKNSPGIASHERRER